MQLIAKLLEWQSNCKRRDYQQSNSFQQVIFGLPSYIMINALWAWIVIILPRKYSTENISPGTHSQERDKIIMKVVQLSNSQANSKEKRTWLWQCYRHSRPAVAPPQQKVGGDGAMFLVSSNKKNWIFCTFGGDFPLLLKSWGGYVPPSPPSTEPLGIETVKFVITK